MAGPYIPDFSQKRSGGGDSGGYEQNPGDAPLSEHKKKRGEGDSSAAENMEDTATGKKRADPTLADNIAGDVKRLFGKRSNGKDR